MGNRTSMSTRSRKKVRNSEAAPHHPLPIRFEEGSKRAGKDNGDASSNPAGRSSQGELLVMKRKEPPKDVFQPTDAPSLYNAKLERFFSGCNPVSASEIITALAAGTVLKVNEIHNDAIPAVVLLSTIGLREHQQQIVDDYVFLIQRMNDLFSSMRDNEFTNADIWHPELFLVSMICIHGPAGEYLLNEVPEAGYMFDVYNILVNNELENLFPTTVKMKEIA